MYVPVSESTIPESLQADNSNVTKACSGVIPIAMAATYYTSYYSWIFNAVDIHTELK